MRDDDDDIQDYVSSKDVNDIRNKVLEEVGRKFCAVRTGDEKCQDLNHPSR